MPKRRGLDEMRIRVENLKKLFGEDTITHLKNLYTTMSTSELDMLYLVYFTLRREKCKVQGERFGILTNIIGEREYKPSSLEWYSVDFNGSGYNYPYVEVEYDANEFNYSFGAEYCDALKAHINRWYDNYKMSSAQGI